MSHDRNRLPAPAYPSAHSDRIYFPAQVSTGAIYAEMADLNPKAALPRAGEEAGPHTLILAPVREGL
jgi:hypothetical protein